MSLSPFSLRTLSDRALLAALRELAARDADLEADLLVHLGEMDARELYLAEGYPSLFAWCTEVLHFSEWAAYHRIAAARAARAFPLVLERVRAGEVHLSGVRLLAPHLTKENQVELLDRARHRSKRAIEEMLADRAPKPDVPAQVRKLPEPVPPSAPRLPVAQPPAPTPPPVPAQIERPAPHPEPLGVGRYKLAFTASHETHAKLREAQALLRHQIPDGDLAKVFDRALDALIREARREKFAETSSPREARTSASPASRHIPAAIKRAVVKRDEGRCTFVARDGKRCDSRVLLEFHHKEPFARSPNHREQGITLRCRAHNRHAAIEEFGAEYMARFRTSQLPCPRTSPGPSSNRDAPGVDRLLCPGTEVW